MPLRIIEGTQADLLLAQLAELLGPLDGQQVRITINVVTSLPPEPSLEEQSTYA